MKADFVPVCQEHQTTMEWRPATFEYAEEGVSVCVTGPMAWVCPVDGEASYTPEGFDGLLVTDRAIDDRRARDGFSRLAQQPDEAEFRTMTTSNGVIGRRFLAVVPCLVATADLPRRKHERRKRRNRMD
jgi:hypothetical protein